MFLLNHTVTFLFEITVINKNFQTWMLLDKCCFEELVVPTVFTTGNRFQINVYIYDYILNFEAGLL